MEKYMSGVIKAYPKRTICFKITSNNQLFTLRSDIVANRVKIQKLMIKNSTANYATVKIRVEPSQLNQCIDANSSSDYFWTAGISPDGVLLYEAHPKHWDFSSMSMCNIRDWKFTIYIDDTEISDAHFASNPCFIEVQYK